MRFTATFSTPPDQLGRRSFVLAWIDDTFRHELGPDGKRIGFYRGQCFRAVPARVFDRLATMGHTVEVSE